MLGSTKKQAFDPGKRKKLREARGGKRTDHHANDANTTKDDESCLGGCKSKHLLTSCSVYQGLTANEKWEVVKEHKRCRKCLRVSHYTNDCTKADGTTCGKCKRNHHRSLHNEKKEDPLKSNLDPDAPAFNDRKSPDKPSLKAIVSREETTRALTMSRTYLEFVQFRISESEIAKETSKP